MTVRHAAFRQGLYAGLREALRLVIAERLEDEPDNPSDEGYMAAVGHMEQTLLEAIASIEHKGRGAAVPPDALALAAAARVCCMPAVEAAFEALPVDLDEPKTLRLIATVLEAGRLLDNTSQTVAPALDRPGDAGHHGFPHAGPFQGVVDHIIGLIRADEQIDADGDQDPSDPAGVLLGLRAVAARQVEHTNLGLCPDQIEGADVRDPDCPACQALIRADALLMQPSAVATTFSEGAPK